jgi:hypothetical protein
VANVSINPDGKFAFVELKTEDLAGLAMNLDKVDLCGRQINVGRPRGYVDPVHGGMPSGAPAPVGSMGMGGQMMPGMGGGGMGGGGMGGGMPGMGGVGMGGMIAAIPVRFHPPQLVLTSLECVRERACACAWFRGRAREPSSNRWGGLGYRWRLCGARPSTATSSRNSRGRGEVGYGSRVMITCPKYTG